MKKTSGALLLCAVLAANLAACGQGNDNNTANGYDNTADYGMNDGINDDTAGTDGRITGSGVTDGNGAITGNGTTYGNGTMTGNGTTARTGSTTASNAYPGGYYGGGSDPDTGYYGPGTGADGSYDRSEADSYDADYRNGSLMDRAGEAVTNGVRDARTDLDRAGDALTGKR